MSVLCSPSAVLPKVRVELLDAPRGELGMRHLAPDVGGDNMAPVLRWGSLAGIHSWAVTCFDPSAPTGSGMWHWVVANLPGETSVLRPDSPALQAGLAFRNDLGARGYTGPFVVDRRRHYVFSVWAVASRRLYIPPSSSNAVARLVIMQNAVAYGSAIAVYPSPQER